MLIGLNNVAVLMVTKSYSLYRSVNVQLSSLYNFHIAAYYFIQIYTNTEINVVS